MYAKIVDGQVNKYPYSILELRKDNPQVSYPENPNEEVLNSLGIFSIVPENPPTYKQATQRCDRVLPTFQNGRWVETWQVSELSEAEKIKVDEEKEQDVRAIRDRLLVLNVDSISHIRWSLLSEEEKQTVLAYRQALLDVPQQEGFPWEVSWPEPPEL
jgi:hypothetical protein